MDETTRIILIYAVLPIVLGIGAWIMKNFLGRLEQLERQLPEKLDELAVRQIVADKIEPIRDDIRDIKLQLNKITDILMDRK